MHFGSSSSLSGGMGNSGVCAPEWSTHGGCPYGTAIKVPTSDFTLKLNPTFLDFIAMFFSLMPAAVTASLLVLFVMRRGLRQVLLFFLVGLTGVVTITLKAMFQQARPLGSCLTSCGMPSGHSSFALSMLVFLVCEYAVRNAGPSEQQSLTDGAASSASPSAPMGGPKSGLPVLVLIAALLLPVPWSRVQLLDHSLAQVLAGSLCGTIFGSLYFAFTLKVVVPKAEELCKLIHINDDYSPGFQGAHATAEEMRPVRP